MTTIMISANYIGNVIRAVKNEPGISATKLMHLFKCDIKQLHRYENGDELIPREILKQIFRYAVQMNTILEKE